MAIKIISLSGYIEAGKNQFCTILQNQLLLKSGPRWFQKAHATKLKQVASILLNVPVAMFENQEFKKTNLGPEWARTIKDAKQWLNLKYPTIDYDHATASIINQAAHDAGFKFTRTVREFMQELGTDALRYNLHENVWVNALWCDYTLVPQGLTHEYGHRIRMNYELEQEFPNWIITDTRFGNEAEAVKNRSGVMVRINRGSKTSDHASETTIDTFKDWDYQIDNTGTLEQLHEKAKEFINHFNL